jgi:hypothetical protein
MIINNHIDKKHNRFHMVHSNVGLSPSSIGIGCPIIQITGDYINFTLHLTLLMSQPLRAIHKFIVHLHRKTDSLNVILIHILTWSYLVTTNARLIGSEIHSWKNLLLSFPNNLHLDNN